MDGSKGLFSTSLIVFILKILGAGLSLVNTIFIARELGVNDAGVYFFAFSVLVFLSTFSRLGVDNAIVKSSSLHLSSRALGKIKYEFLTVLFVISLFSFLVSFIVFFSVTYFGWSALNGVVIYFFLGIAGFSVSFIVSSFFLGMGYPILSALIVSVFIPSVFLMLLAICKFLLYYELTLEICFFLYCLSVFFVSSFSSIYLYSKMRNVKTVKSNLNSLYGLAKVFFISVAVDLIFLNTPIFLLERFSTTSDVAMYSVSLRVATLLAFVFVSLNKVFSPSFTVMYAKGALVDMFILIKKCMMLISLCGLGFMVLCYFFSDYILFLFGEDYRDASFLLLLFILFQTICSLYYFIRNIFQLTGQEIMARRNDCFLAIIGFFSALVLTSNFESTGAVLSLVISVSIVLLISVTQLLKGDVYLTYKNSSCT